LEFRQELASKICMVVERYAPNRKWHIDTIIQVMATTTSTGFNREPEVISNLFILVSNTPDLQSYCTFKLYECLSTLQLESDPIRQITSWLIGEYGDKLMDPSECQEANEELEKDKRSGGMGMNEDDDDDDAINNPHHGIEQMTMDIGPFKVKTTDEVVAMLKYIVKHDKSTETTKGFGLTALMKMWHKYQLKNIDKDTKIMDILEQFRDDKQIEVQQRSVEFVSLFESTDEDARKKILKPMPVPKIERLFDQRTTEEKNDDSDDDDDDTDSDSSEEEESASSEEQSEDSESSSEEEDKSSSEDSLASDSDDSKATRKRKRKERKKREKAKKKAAEEKEKEKKRKKEEKRQRKKKKEAPIVPKLSGPDDMEQANGGDIGFDTPTKANGGGHGNQMANGGNQQRAQQPQPDPGNLLDITQINNNNGGGGMDPLGVMDLLGPGPSNPAPPTNPSSDPVGDLLFGTSPASSSMAASSSPQSGGSPMSSGGKAQPFEAYKNHGITATFNFQPNQGRGVCRVLAVFHNSNSYDINNFSFMIAVPKYIKLQFKPANGTQLLALSQNSITQKFQLSNTMYGTKPFIIRVQVVFTQNGQQMKDRTQVQFPDNCC